MITRLPTRFGIALAMTAAVVLGGCSSGSSDTTLVPTNSVVPSAAATDGVGTESANSDAMTSDAMTTETMTSDAMTAETPSSAP